MFYKQAKILHSLISTAIMTLIGTVLMYLVGVNLTHVTSLPLIYIWIFLISSLLGCFSSWAYFRMTTEYRDEANVPNRILFKLFGSNISHLFNLFLRVIIVLWMYFEYSRNHFFLKVVIGSFQIYPIIFSISLISSLYVAEFVNNTAGKYLTLWYYLDDKSKSIDPDTFHTRYMRYLKNRNKHLLCDKYGRACYDPIMPDIAEALKDVKLFGKNLFTIDDKKLTDL